ncbi:MAG TPA: hypothetical protein EYP59_19805 [Thiotrichaceae bacterium]|nr:hypothetical protein [Thiotrichaceae bacterium]
MSKNKILSAAIVAALSTGVQAGEFKLLQNDGSTEMTTPYIYAYEQFPASGTDALDYQYYAEYTVANAISADIYVTFTLSAGTWGSRLSSSDLTLTSTSTTPISIVDQGQTDQSSAQFLVASAGDQSLSANDKLKLKFKVGGVAGVLSVAGTPIKLDVVFATASGGTGIPDEPKSVSVASSGVGAEIELKKDQTAGDVAIDVARGGTVFLGGLDDTTVSLGTVNISNPSNKLKNKNGTLDWDFSASEGTLTVRDGIFAASTPESVYLDLVSPQTEYNAPSGTSSTGDIKADSVDATEATWKLSSDELNQIYTSTTAVPIIVKANGTSIINENGNPPNATFTIKYATDAVYSGKLRHIERNGMVCKLYNIPNPDATDALSIRVTNKTALTGLVLGTLTAMDTTALFTNETLVEALAPQNTVRLGIDDLVAKLPEGTTSWAGRAVLTLNSDLTDIEIFGLVRNKAGGPLMNMSLDASGNACD